MSTPRLAELALTRGVPTRRFLAFVRRLYAGDPGYCATLELTLESALSASTSFFPRCSCRPVAVERGGEIVGMDGHLSVGVGLLVDGFGQVTFGSTWNKPYYASYFADLDRADLTVYSGLTSDAVQRVRRLTRRAPGEVTVREVDLRRLSRLLAPKLQYRPLTTDFRVFRADNAAQVLSPSAQVLSPSDEGEAA